MLDLAAAADRAGAWACYDCGKCTGTCPLARAGAPYSPRRHVLAAGQDQPEALLEEQTVFDCLTCGMCDSRCPVEIGYTDLVRALRETLAGADLKPKCPHGGALQSVMRMMARGAQQDRLGWLDGDLRTESERGSVFLWTGCAVYYDAFFSDLGLCAVGGNRAAVRLLNALGETPVVSPDERCCGHDLLWNGDREGFEALARLNTELVRESGAETLVVPCAECLRTWKLDYEPLMSGGAPRVLHLAEYLAERVGELGGEGDGESLRVTYSDPCRLGRHLGIYDAPREVLSSLPGIELAEMPRSRHKALCCAGGTWSSCDRYAKQIQVDRLREARDTGAEVLVTSCPKCQIHLRCAMRDVRLAEEITIEMLDLGELVAARVGLNPKG